jgi:Amphi-Trp domain
MELVEIKQKERVQREQSAARLRELADQLSRHNDVEFERDGVTFKMRVPDEVSWNLSWRSETTAVRSRSSSPGDSPL